LPYFFSLIFLAVAAWLALQPGLWPGALVMAIVTLVMLVRSVRARERALSRPPRASRPRKRRPFPPRADREGGND
jgi:hypothetical protein